LVTENYCGGIRFIRTFERLIFEKAKAVLNLKNIPQLDQSSGQHQPSTPTAI